VTELNTAFLGTDVNGSSDSAALAINSAGTTIGYANRYGNGNFAGIAPMVWSASGKAATLGSTSPAAYALAINDAGTAVGFQGVPGVVVTLDDHATRWNTSTGTATLLGDLGNGTNVISDAVAINKAGTAVGYSGKFNGTDIVGRPVRWDASGTAAIELGNFVAGFNARASDINDAGNIVGTADTPSGPRAEMWTPDGTTIDLNSLIDPASGWTLTTAYHISQDNWISGLGQFDPDGPGPMGAYNRLYIIQVPEPSSIALLALAWALKRRHRLRLI
jgi:probable HAF family extracellular repeat protein